jgi:hypothetical protein
MGVIEFFILVLIVVFLGWVTVWALGYFMPGHPALIDKVVWGVVIVFVLWTLFSAMGLMGHDPQIPRVR